MIKSLRRKFVWINMLLVFLALAIVFSLVAVTNCLQAVGESRKTLQMVLDRREGQHPPVFEIGKEPPREFQRSPVFMIEGQGGGAVRLIMEENVSVSDEDLAQILARSWNSPNSEGVLSDYNLRYLGKSGAGSSRMAFIDMGVEKAAIRSAILTSTFSLLGCMLVFFPVSLFLSRWALRPVAEAWERQRRFVADASHELKTPLTVIMANNSILMEHRDEPIEAQIKWVENTALEAARMKRLVDELLFLAKSDEALPAQDFRRLNLCDLAVRTALAFESLAFERSLRIQTDTPEESIFVRGDETQLLQLLSLLLDNAVKYADSGSDIRLSLQASGGRALLRVQNEGEPLSAEVLAQLFDRFYRADSARASEGYGLGLSIAERIVSAHRGSIRAEGGNGREATFLVTLPLG